MKNTILIALAVLMLTASWGHAWAPWKDDKGADKKQVEKIFRKARAAYGSADYSSTVKYCDDAIKADPKFAGAYALRGKAKKDMGDVEAATRDLNKAVELDPTLAEAYYIRGQVHEIMGEMKEAQVEFKKACGAGYTDACK
ncbi:MAG: tetratricopeptide repeat protein [Nitrospinota bacterium]|nr:tetratricopeptide repeat protein [Nitrospinota bacterium]MDH5676980.1 tetratricopeptide repeat protein [Nitrospinota bacterium]MDH5755203.1 tetratricopeptide repeat protein [Nitrospinota bacterium]